MNWKNLLLIGLGGYWLLGKLGSAAANRITWAFDKVRVFKDVKVLQGGFNMRLKVTNNLPTDITLAGYQGEISQDGNLVATIENVDPISLPKGQEVVIAAFAKVNGKGTLAAIASGQLLAPVEVDSYITLGVAGEEVVTVPVFNKLHLFYVE